MRASEPFLELEAGKNVSRHLQTSFTASRKALTNCTQPGLFALTFDDAPTDNFERMLDVLKEHHVPATLFVIGDKLRDPESVALLKRAEKEGHLIENHSWDHPHLSKLSDDEIRHEIERTEQIFHEQLGHGSRFMRAPYGDVGNLIPIAAEYKLTVVECCERAPPVAAKVRPPPPTTSAATPATSATSAASATTTATPILVAWVASWHEGGKPKFENFYVSEHGFHKAKVLAEEHRLEMERSGRASVRKPAEHQSGVRGVNYMQRNHAWRAEWQEAGEKKGKTFSVKELGFEKAKQMAIAHRRAMESRHYTFVGKGSSRAARRR
ncbi:unnamed protein product [Vitrella brassicaformis CCMP3155]|uniref:NodB homology domain-containing protein n=1 Tax=Vitrella brassicaformis (strain CCMP3155) TaxID=1169540 RepID=A0A0G4F659_VITBC|nr:unnamed protein product [Vitrella brassicaformis CCMP3155]|eukprot:CEM07885.1 unnamed protein product [Vitrella brassicaformis CCMP3155]